MLNQNAFKFRLNTLNKSELRYDNIYKNIFRDARKLFTSMFNQQTQYIRDKTMNYKDAVRTFILNTFTLETLNQLGVTIDRAVFLFGSFIYPKQMITMIVNSKELTPQETLV